MVIKFIKIFAVLITCAVCTYYIRIGPRQSSNIYRVIENTPSLPPMTWNDMYCLTYIICIVTEGVRVSRNSLTNVSEKKKGFQNVYIQYRYYYNIYIYINSRVFKIITTFSSDILYYCNCISSTCLQRLHVAPYRTD
jgi:hypothetical protein